MKLKSRKLFENNSICGKLCYIGVVPSKGCGARRKKFHFGALPRFAGEKGREKGENV